MTRIPRDFITEVEVCRFVVPREEKIEHRVNDRLFRRIWQEVAFGYIGNMMLAIHQYVIPWLVLVWLRLVRLVPSVVRLECRVEVDD